MTPSTPTPGKTRAIAAAIAVLGVGALVIVLVALLGGQSQRPTPPPAEVLTTPPTAAGPPAQPPPGPRAAELSTLQAFSASFALYLQGRVAAAKLPDATPALRARIASEHRPRQPAGDTPVPSVTSERIENPRGAAPAHEALAQAVIDDGYSLTPIALLLQDHHGRWLVTAIQETG